MKKFSKAITHNGMFHADDVFAAALVAILWPEIDIVRVAKVENVTDDTLVFDIGFGEFDHHQTDNEVRKNGIPYAAFGKLWRAFGHELCLSESAWNEVEATLVQPIDYTDNTGDRNPLSLAIRHMNPTWDSEETADEAFLRAVCEIAMPILKSSINNANAKDRADLYLETMKPDAIVPGVLVLDKFVPWHDYVIEKLPDIRFVIYPSNRGGYNINVVPIKPFAKEYRCPFPKEWCNGPSTVVGLTFCHPAGFMAVSETLEDAVTIAQMAIDKNEEE